MKIALLGGGGGWNSFTKFGTNAGAMQRPVYSKLIDRVRGPDATYADGYVMGLAKDYEISDDNKVETFYLREDVYWHDGEKFTADDVVFTYWAHLNAPEVVGKPTAIYSRFKPAVSALNTVEKIDDYTVRITYDKPLIREKIYGYSSFFMMPQHIWDPEVSGYTIADNPANEDLPVGTGPFICVDWVKDQYATYVANDDYYRGRPYLDEFTYVIFPRSSPESAMLAFDSGEVDAVSDVRQPMPIRDVSTYQKIPGIVADWKSAHVAITMRFNFAEDTAGDNPWVNDRNVRNAFGMAIDRQEIIDVVYDGLANPAYSIIGENLQADFYNPAIEDMPMLQYNPDAAEDLLDAAGYPKDSNGIRIEADMVVQAAYTELAEVVREQLMKVGISVDLTPVVTFYNEYEKGLGGLKEFPLGLYPMVIGPDYSHGLIQSASWSFPELGGYNCGYYVNQTVDDLWNSILESSDMDFRIQQSKKLQEILVDDMPIIYMVQSTDAMVWKEEFVCPEDGFFRPAGHYWDPAKVYIVSEEEPEPPAPVIPEELEDMVEFTSETVADIQASVDDISDSIDELVAAQAAQPTGTSILTYVSILLSLVTLVVVIMLYMQKD
jgi:peptide/nickel transport system substrate-binding protein